MPHAKRRRATPTVAASATHLYTANDEGVFLEGVSVLLDGHDQQIVHAFQHPCSISSEKPSPLLAQTAVAGPRFLYLSPPASGGRRETGRGASAPCGDAKYVTDNLCKNLDAARVSLALAWSPKALVDALQQLVANTLDPGSP